MSAAGGFPDWQRITQWFGNSVAEEAGRVLDAGNLVVGPLNVRSFASIVVWIKAIGGPVTVTVTEQVPDGPASLQTQSSFVVAAGNVVAEAFVLLAGEATVTFQGVAVGTSIDYAIVPANTNVNAEVAALTQLGFQHNDLVVANETAIDFVDSTGVVWTMTDDPANLRMKVAVAQLGWERIADVTLAAPAAAVDFTSIPQKYAHLLCIGGCRSDAAGIASTPLVLKFNGDAGANYESASVEWNNVAAVTGTGSGGTAGIAAITIAAALAIATDFAAVRFEVPRYSSAVGAKGMVGQQWYDTDTTIGARSFGGLWRNVAAINRLTLTPGSGNLIAGSRFTLYGLT